MYHKTECECSEFAIVCAVNRCKFYVARDPIVSKRISSAIVLSRKARCKSSRISLRNRVAHPSFKAKGSRIFFFSCRKEARDAKRDKARFGQSHRENKNLIHVKIFNRRVWSVSSSPAAAFPLCPQWSPGLE